MKWCKKMNMWCSDMDDDNIHLDRVWKSKNAKTRQWIEISKGHLETHFRAIN